MASVKKLAKVGLAKVGQDLDWPKSVEKLAKVGLAKVGLAKVGHDLDWPKSVEKLAKVGLAKVGLAKVGQHSKTQTKIGQSRLGPSWSL